MDSSDLALLLGLGLGGFGGYLGGKRRDERERAQKKEDREELAKFERELAAQLREDQRIEAETARFKEEGRFTEGERRGELKNPNSLYNFLFNPSESDPIHEMLSKTGITLPDPFSSGRVSLADALVGTTAYDDPNIRNQQREDFVANPESNFFNDTGALGLASLLIPGMGLFRGANIASKFMPASIAGLGPRMMTSMRNYFRSPTGTTATAPSIPAMAYGGMNQGGRVGLSEGTDERGVIDRAVDVGADFITRLGRGVVRPEDYDAEDVPGFIKYFNPLDFIGTFNEATGLQRLLMGPDQQADQRVLDILGTLNPNYDPDVVGTGEILDPLLMQMYGFPQDTRGLED